MVNGLDEGMGKRLCLSFYENRILQCCNADFQLANKVILNGLSFCENMILQCCNFDFQLANEV